MIRRQSDFTPQRSNLPERNLEIESQTNAAVGAVDLALKRFATTVLPLLTRGLATKSLARMEISIEGESVTKLSDETLKKIEREAVERCSYRTSNQEPLLYQKDLGDAYIAGATTWAHHDQALRKELETLNGMYISACAQRFEATVAQRRLIADIHTARSIIDGFRRGSCFCDVGIGDPRSNDHDLVCYQARSFLAGPGLK